MRPMLQTWEGVYIQSQGSPESVDTAVRKAHERRLGQALIISADT